MVNTEDEYNKKTAKDLAIENIKITRDDIDKLEETMVIADENGLFKSSKSNTKFSDIMGNMVAACKEFDNEKKTPENRYIQGWSKYRAAHYQFNEVLNSASIDWRFKFLYGGPLIIYFLAFLITVLLIWVFFDLQISNTKIFWVPTYAFLWGLVGGVLQGLWFLWQHVSDRTLRKVWIPWYLLLPLIGALLGALTYLIFVAGFITTTGGAQIQSEYFIMLLCALAGFSSLWAVETLDRIADLIKIG
jgi:hypothetical protein